MKQQEMQNADAGMTLLEVVLGVALLGIVFLSFTNLFAGGLGASLESGRITQAALLAQEKMEQLRANSYASLLAQQGQVHGGALPGSDNLRYSYHISGETLLFGSHPVHGLRLDLTILRGEKAVVRFVSFVREES